MSVRREFDDDDEVEALRYDLETLASQARADAVVTESFSAALERRLEQGHAPCVAIDTGGAAAREPPPEDEPDVSSQSGDDDESAPADEPDNAKSADEGDDGEVSTVDNSENALSEDELDAIFLKNNEIRDEIETINRLLKRGLSADDLKHVIRHEKKLLSELRGMRQKLKI